MTSINRLTPETPVAVGRCDHDHLVREVAITYDPDEGTATMSGSYFDARCEYGHPVDHDKQWSTAGEAFTEDEYLAMEVTDLAVNQMIIDADDPLS